MDVAEAGATDVSDLAMQERCDNDQQTSSASTPSTDAPVPQASDAQYISGKCAGNQQMLSSPMASAYLPTAKFSRMDNSKSSDSLHVTSSAVPLPAIPTAEIPDEAISVESKDGHWALMAPVVSPPIAERSDAGEPCSVLNARASSFPVPQTDPPPAEASNGGVSDEKSGTSGGKQQSIGPIVVNSDTQADKFSCMDKTDGNCSANNRASLEHCADLPVPMPPSSSCQGSLDPCRYDIVTGSIPNGDVKNQPMFTNNKKSEQCNPTQRSYARSSRYHGVSRNRWTGKFESHLWDGTFHFEGRPRKGKLVYLGGYKSEEMAGRVHDLAAIKYWGPKLKTKLNFSISEYEREIEEMKTVSREEYIASLIRKSSCFSRGASIYRGVTRKKDGRWQSRIGHVGDCKDIYLGTYGTEVEAAEAYDLAAIELKGPKAVTNFDMSNYSEEIKLWLERQQTGNLPLNENV